jgi:magnesium-protoporphyrin IX monomethyl ester (oxidative) cyclase
MNVLLVHPGPLMYTKIYLRLEPLGLELVASAARALGHRVTLLDLQVESSSDYVRLLREHRPDAVGFSCNYLANVPEVVDLAKLTKRVVPRCAVFVGGHSASFVAETILVHGDGAIDCILKGEGETAVGPGGQDPHKTPHHHPRSGPATAPCSLRSLIGTISRA